MNLRQELEEKRYLNWIIEQEALARRFANEIIKVKEEEKMIKECHVYFKKQNPDFAVICIPGRGNDGAMFAHDYHKQSEIETAVFIGPTPNGYAWYPMPYDANNQAAALNGIPAAIKAIEAVQKAVEKRFGIPKRKTILTGFSAGGVMAIQTAAHSEESYAGVICHSGAILEPRDLPECVHDDCPVLLTHNEDDYCFDWNERFLPMKEALVEKGWNTFTIERTIGGHTVSNDDIREARDFIGAECKLILE